MSRAAANTVVVVLALAACAACKDPPPPVVDSGVEALVLRRIPDAPIVVSIPKSWSIETPELPPLIEPKETKSPHAKDGGLTAVEAAAAAYPRTSRVLLRARPPAPRPGSLVPATLLVLHDPWLPKGTTGVDYLVAQRATNQAVVGSRIQHVEAEPSRRQGRPAYTIRDEWTVPGPNGAIAPVAQEALLLLDADGAWLHGYAVVVTLEKRDLPALHPTIRAILASVGFKDRAVAPKQP